MSQVISAVSKKALLALLLFGVLSAFILAELVSRATIFYFEGHGLSLDQLLNQSSNNKLNQQNFPNLRGLIKPSSVRDMVYELKPNLSGTFMSVDYSSNSHGMRDREYSINKAENTYRIAAIGDSVLFGWGVEQQDTYLDLVENQLNQSSSNGRKFEALNFGTPGYNTAMQVSLLENKAIKFAPDLILLHVVNNDLEVPLFMMKPHNVFALNKSFLWNLIFSSSGSELVRHSTKTSSNILQEYRHLSGFGAYSQALAKLAKIAENNNISVIIIHGMLGDLMSKRLHKFSKKNSYKLIDVKPFIDRLLAENAIANNPVARAKALQISSLDPHPNALGHKAYAQAVLSTIHDITN